MKYAWIGVDGKDVIFLNDFRWSSELIPWEIFLVLLEGEVIYFTLPKIILARIWLYLLTLLSLPLQRQWLGILMILLKAGWRILDGRYLSLPIKYHHFNIRIWHQVSNSFVILFCWKKCEPFTYFARFYFILIYLTYP